MPTTAPSIAPIGMVKRARHFAPHSLLAGMLTTEEAAEYVGLTVQSLYAYRMGKVKAGGPKSYKHHGRVLYKQSELDSWLASRG
jgi:hypothetical protein